MPGTALAQMSWCGCGGTEATSIAALGLPTCLPACPQSEHTWAHAGWSPSGYKA